MAGRIFLAPVVGYHRVELANKDVVSKTNVNVVNELGAYLFFSSNWHLKAFVKSINVPDELWSEAFYKQSGNRYKIDYSSIYSVGLSLGYIIPNYIWN